MLFPKIMYMLDDSPHQHWLGNVNCRTNKIDQEANSADAGHCCHILLCLSSSLQGCLPYHLVVCGCILLIVWSGHYMVCTALCCLLPHFFNQCHISHCVPVTFLRSRGKFMSGDTFPGGAFFSSEGRFFFFRGALFFLQRGSFWSVEYAEKKSGGHRPPWKKKCDQKPPLKISSQWFLLICHTSLCLHRSLFSLNSI